MNLNQYFVFLTKFVDDMPTWGLVVLACSSQLINFSVDREIVSPWVKISSFLLFAIYFLHQYVSDEIYELGQFVVAGVRSLALTSIYFPLAAISDFVLQRVVRWIKARSNEIESSARRVREHRAEQRKRKLETKRQKELQRQQEQPVDERMLFEQAMKAARDDFERQCRIIESFDELDEFERASAVDQARANMTRRIHEIMGGDTE